VDKSLWVLGEFLATFRISLIPFSNKTLRVKRFKTKVWPQNDKRVKNET